MKQKFLLAAALAVAVVPVLSAETPDLGMMMRKDHPRMFFNAETWPAIKARAFGEQKTALQTLLRECDRYPADPVVTGTEPPKPRLVKTKSGVVEMPPSPHTGIPPIKEFGCHAASCALAWRFTGERRYLDKCVAMLKANIRGYDEAYANRRAVCWYSTGRICSLCAYDWIFNDLTPDQRREIIVPLLKHVEQTQDSSLKIHRRNGGLGHNAGFYGVSSLPWYAALAAYGDGLCDDLAERFLKLGYENAMRMLVYRNAGAGDDGSLGGCCLGYCLGAYPWAHFNFFHTYLSAMGRNLAADYPNMALFPNWIWWTWIPDDRTPTHPFFAGLGDTYHTTGRMGNEKLYEHMSQYMFFYRDVDPAAARLAASLRERAPNRNIGSLQFAPGGGVQQGGWPIYPFLLAGMDDVKPFAAGELENAPLKARHFEQLGHVLMRSGWKPGDTFCAFNAGARLMMHKHNDENSFVIFKHDFLALDTGTRANQTDYNLKHYYAQTVAHNCILIHKPGEPLPGHWGPQYKGPEGRTNYGGQYPTPTATVQAFDTDARYTYVASDAAKCYGEKCRRALRQFIHLQPDTFVVYDRVDTDAPYRKEWLLHTENEPAVEGRLLRADSRRGRLFCETFLPEDAKLEKVGGEGREFWANGKNWEIDEKYLADAAKVCAEAGSGPYLGRWRLEVTPSAPSTEDRFLNVLTATDTGVTAPPKARYVKEEGRDGVEIELPSGKVTVMFDRTGTGGGTIRFGDGPVEKLREDVLPQSGVMLSAEKPASPVRALAERFVACERNGSVNDSKSVGRDIPAVSRLEATLGADGTWPDVDYVTNERGYCPKVAALARMRQLAVAGRREAYLRALGWWLRNRPENPNWWWNEIGFPQSLGEGAVVARDWLSPEERRGVCEILRVSDRSGKRTGQNHVWLARIKLMRALIEEDAALAHEAVDEIAGEIVLSDCEGIRSDWCFHQHGRQPQFGNYGLSFIQLITRLTEQLDGTEFAFPPEKRALLKGLLENGYRWICWKGFMDVSAMGRQVTAGAQRDKARAVERTFGAYARIDPTFPKEPPVGFRFFDQSAYAVYRTKDWMASVRMATTKVVGAETGINSENVRGGNTCDGALLTYVTGREYLDVTPLWGAWRHIPGITGYEDDQPRKGKDRIVNGSDDVRGYEENGEGVVKMELKKDGLRAFKSWRFSEKGILCEGHGICSDDPREVITPVEEAWAADDARLLPYDGRYVRAINGKIGYVIEAKPEDIRFSVEERSGDYRLTHPTQPSHPVKGKVFSLVISHGIRPKDAGYRYRVIPNVPNVADLAAQTP